MTNDDRPTTSIDLSKKRVAFVKAVFGLLALTIALPMRSIFYAALYGFDDQKSYRADIAECHFVLKCFPDNSAEHHRLADILMDKMYDTDNPRLRLAEAIREYMEAIRLDPTDAMAYYDLAGIYETQFHDNLTANVCYNKCVEINPTSPYPQSFLANSDEAIGKHGEARLHQHISDQLLMGQSLR